jgi:STE24 endopeptidase
VNEDRAARYHRLRRRASAISAAAVAAFVALLAVSGWGARWPLVWFVALIALGCELVAFPCTVYTDFLLERKYGLSSASFRPWLRDRLKGIALGLAIWELVVFGVYGLMRWTAQAWWLAGTVAFAAVTVVLSRMGSLLSSTVYPYRPVQREALRSRLLRLSQKAGIQVLGVFEWRLGGTRANAALAGFGRTCRILVSDTLLENYSDEEIEVILAHEIAHHVHHDMAKGLALEIGIAGAALLTAHLAVTQTGYAPDDRAALPLLALAAAAAVMLLLPIRNAWSRRNERRADRFALALTGGHDAFISAMRRLAAHNLAEPDPSRGVLWFFHTHPAFDERIAAAQHGRAHAENG